MDESVFIKPSTMQAGVVKLSIQVAATVAGDNGVSTDVAGFSRVHGRMMYPRRELSPGNGNSAVRQGAQYRRIFLSMNGWQVCICRSGLGRVARLEKGGGAEGGLRGFTIWSRPSCPGTK